MKHLSFLRIPRLLSYLAIFILITSCNKLDSIMQSVSDLKTQNDSLEAQLLRLQVSVNSIEALNLQNADSLAIIDAKINSLLSSINSINQQLLTNPNNTSDIGQELLLLTQDYQSLLALMNQMMACCPQCNLNLNNGLVAYYPFTGNPGDSSGYGNNAFVYGATLTTDRFGHANSAYNFSSSASIDAPSQSWINFGTASFSLNAWVYMSAPQANHFNGILTKGDSGAFIYQLGVDSLIAAGEFGNPYLMDFTNLESNHLLSPGSWYLLTMNIDRDSSRIQLFVNGTLSATYNSGAVSNENISSSDSLRIGVERDLQNHFNGKIDDIRIYNRVLSSAEIAWLAAH